MIGPCEPYFSREELVDAPGYCPPPENATGWDDILDSIRVRASEVVYVLLGRQFPGACSTRRWPVRRGECFSELRLPFESMLYDAAPVNDAIPLWYSPRDIVVTIDGEQFDDWVLRDGVWLTRVDGLRWPDNKDLDLDDEGAFTIEWTFGPSTPGIVTTASLELGVQFELEILGDPRCKLPTNTVGLNRQGQNITIDRDVERVREAGPSLQSLMIATAAFNPTGARQPPDVWSPDHVWELVEITKPVPGS